MFKGFQIILKVGDHLEVIWRYDIHTSFSLTISFHPLIFLNLISDASPYYTNEALSESGIRTRRRRSFFSFTRFVVKLQSYDKNNRTVLLDLKFVLKKMPGDTCDSDICPRNIYCGYT